MISALESINFLASITSFMCSGAENGGSGHGGSGFLFGTRVGEIKGRKSRKSRGCCCEHGSMDGSVATEFRSSNCR